MMMPSLFQKTYLMISLMISMKISLERKIHCMENMQEI